VTHQVTATEAKAKLLALLDTQALLRRGMDPERLSDTATESRPPLPGDPADRIIYATAIEQGWPLITRDRRMHECPYSRNVAVW
jgi:PIN domain nuclease of toxin-antitoxin system